MLGITVHLLLIVETLSCAKVVRHVQNCDILPRLLFSATQLKQHSSTTLIDQAKIRWKPAAILTNTKIFMTESVYVEVLHRCTDLCTLLEKVKAVG